MIENYSVLIIDDIPITCEAYKSILENFALKNEYVELKVDIAYDCKTAYQKLFESNKAKEIDLVFLDIRLPPYEEAKIFSGEDLGIRIRQKLPNTKVVIFTFYNEYYRIHNIFKNLNPEGFMIKDDFASEELTRAIKTIATTNVPYYSKTVLNLLRLQQLFSDILLDKKDRHLLYELSISTKIIDLPKKILLAKPTIEKRIYRLQEIFDVNNRSELILAAKEKGFI